MITRIKNSLFQNNSTRQTVVKNTFWLFVGEIVGRLLRFSIVVYAARVLGAADYGIFSFALTIAAFATIFADIGISAVITRETSRQPELRERYFGAALGVKAILILASSLLVLFGVPLFASVPAALPLLPLVVLIFAFDSLREFGFGLNRALEQMEREAFIKILMNGAITILGFAALFFSPTPYALAVSYAVGSGLGCLLTAWLLREYIRALQKGIDWSLAWPLFKMAWPVGMLGLLGAIMINTDMIMLGWWVSPTELGQYAAAQKIILLLYIAPSLIASAAFPALARLADKSGDAFRSILEESTAAVQALALPLAVGGILVAPQLIRLLFGAEYVFAAPTLIVLLTSLVLVFPTALFSNALFAFNEQRRFLWYLALGAGSNALCNWLLIPSYGLMGAAAATIISQLLTTFFVWHRIRQRTGARFAGRLVRIILATLAVAAATGSTIAQTDSAIAAIAAGVATYGAALLILREPLLTTVLSRLRRH